MASVDRVGPIEAAARNFNLHLESKFFLTLKSFLVNVTTQLRFIQKNREIAWTLPFWAIIYETFQRIGSQAIDFSEKPPLILNLGEDHYATN